MKSIKHNNIKDTIVDLSENSSLKKLASYLSNNSFNYILQKLENAKATETAWNPKAGKTSNPESTIKEMKTNFLTIKEDLKKWDDKFLQKLKRKKVPYANKIGVIIDFATDILQGLAWLLSNAAQLMTKGVQIFASFVMGIINGLLDIVYGIVFLIKLVLNGVAFGYTIISGVKHIISNQNERQVLLEQLDNLFDLVKEINFKELIKTIYNNFINFFEKINFNAILKKIKEGTSKFFSRKLTIYEIAYFLVCFILYNIT